MTQRTTSFWRTGTPDAPLVQNASTPFDAAERRMIDEQITGLQQVLAAALVNGAVATYAQIDASSQAIVVGDVLCRSTASSLRVTLATSAAIAAAGAAFAVALGAGAPGARIPVAVAGAIGPTITGLAASAGVCRVSSVGRPVKVSSYSSGDYPLGKIDAQGWLILAISQPDAVALGIAYGVSTPEAVAASGAVGVAATVSRSDHAHAHGSQAGDSLHATAVGSVAAGFISAADQQKLDDATPDPTPVTLAFRGDTGECSFSGVGCEYIAIPVDASFTLSQGEHATGAGNPQSWSGQDAKSGSTNDGGALLLKGGDRGDSDHWAGDIKISLGPEDDNSSRSAYMSWFNTADWTGTPILKLYDDSGAAKFECGSTGLIIATAGASAINMSSAGGSISIGQTQLTITGSLQHTTGNLGFFGATPAAQPSAYTQTYSTGSRTVNAYTSDAESSAYTGIDNAQGGTPYAKLEDLNTLRGAYETLRASHDNLLQVVTQILDDLQTLGLLQ
jgi:hypothetical protein